MTKRGFDPRDDLYIAATRAQVAVHDLHVKAGYASCKHGVGKAAEGPGALRFSSGDRYTSPVRFSSAIPSSRSGTSANRL
jgi:hypothetical protein